MSTRIKTYYKSSELPHVFIHRGAPHGKCPTAETFSGDKYFSYAACIGQLVTGKGGAKGIILNSGSYSNTTSNHQSGLRQAVPSDWERFSVEAGGSRYVSSLPTGKDLRDHYLKEHAELLQDPEVYRRGKVDPQTGAWITKDCYVNKPSKYAHKRAERFLLAVHKLDEAIRACRFFGLAHKALDAKLDKLQPEIDKQSSIAQENDDKLKARREKRDATRRLARERQDRRDRDTAKASAEEYISGGLIGIADQASSHYGSVFGYQDHLLDEWPELKPLVAAERILRQTEVEKKEKAESKARAEAFVAGAGNVEFLGSDDYFGYEDNELADWPELQRSVAQRRMEIAAGAVDKWRDGDSSIAVTKAVRSLTLLRREGGEIVTTKGARFPVEHARKAFLLVRTVRRIKEPWQRNGRTIHVGHYELDSIDAEGNVVAGCNRVEFSEIERLAIREGWIESADQLTPEGQAC